MKYEKPMVINLGKAEDLIAGGSYSRGEIYSTICLKAEGLIGTHVYEGPKH